MPKVGMEPIRRASLIKATIAEIGQAGSLEVTVSRIAKRAGMSSALAHHYFGSKEALFLAAMRDVLRLYGAEVRGRAGRGGRGRGAGAGGDPGVLQRGEFPARGDRGLAQLLRPRAVAAPGAPAPQGLSAADGFEPAPRAAADWGDRAEVVAQGIAAMIDGVYLHAALGPGAADPATAAALVEAY
jgi:TetR/AcrR family transcriptional regulator, transcriptional repressor of bet genes